MKLDSFFYNPHTKQVTRHPVCVTAYLPKPPCSYDHDVKEAPRERAEDSIEASRAEIQPTTTAIAQENYEPSTRSAFSLSDSEEVNETGASEEDYVDQVATYRRARGARHARYLVAHPAPVFQKSQEQQAEQAQKATDPLDGTIEKIVVDPLEQNQDVRGPGFYYDGLVNGENHEIVHGLLKETHLVTKTILVTNVQKVIDTKVTATVLAKNCMPSEHIIPHCNSPYGLFKNHDEPELELNPRIGSEDQE